MKEGKRKSDQIWNSDFEDSDYVQDYGGDEKQLQSFDDEDGVCLKK